MISGTWFERQKNIIDYSLQSLLRRRSKNILILIIFVLLIFAVSSILFITGSLTKEMMITSNDLPDITVQRILGGRQVNVPALFIPEIEKIPGVEAVETRVWGYFYLTSLQANFTIYGMDLNLLEEGEYRKIVNWKNVLDQAKKDPQFRMIVGQGVFDLLKDIDMEKAFLFYQPTWERPIPFDIIGTFKTETELQSNDLMVLQTEGARRVLELPPDEFTDLVVYVPNPEEIENIALKIRRMFPELRTVTRAQIQNTYSSVFGWKSAFVLSSLLVAIFAFLILIWDKASGLSPEEKREIGILKAVGWDTDVVLSVKFWEGLLLSGISSLTGILLSYAYIYWLRAPGLREIFIGWSTIYPSFKLIPDVDPKFLLLIITISVIPYLAVTVFPAWKAAITDPDVIIRNV
ncbi:MAG: FtsX-like permease family protein [Deltaproteobacteria bacterium]|nr:FtsX-like permease family protein [Deltaproteobacteria bacterium]